MKIYIVASGQYSDYGILAVFTKKELADKYVSEIIKAGSFIDVIETEEWEADDPEELSKVARSLHVARINLITGKIEVLPKLDMFASPNESGDYFVPPVNKYADGGSMCYAVAEGKSYDSEEHAREMAMQARNEWLKTVALHHRIVGHHDDYLILEPR